MIRAIAFAFRIFAFGSIGTLMCGGCHSKQGRNVTHPQEYNVYLNSYELVSEDDTSLIARAGRRFTDSLPANFGRMASVFRQLYHQTARIEYLKQAEQALTKAVSSSNLGKAAYIRALARNYLIQHRFKEALEMATRARSYELGTTDTQYLLFDIYMETGSYAIAGKYLDTLANRSEFKYLIRLARWKEHNGDMRGALGLIRQASDLTRDAGNRNLQLMTYLQLADYFGRSGNIRDSYQACLKALALDPANVTAKKAIAWIVYSHERNPEEALRILDSVTKHYKTPDLMLLKAEIADYMDDEESRSYHLDQYFNLLRNPAYGNMHNADNIDFYLQETRQYRRALDLARVEVANRPTPASYGLLAYSYLKNRQPDTAKAIVDRHIIGETSEPKTLLRAAEIYKAWGNEKQVSTLKATLSASLFELGPDTGQRVRDL